MNLVFRPSRICALMLCASALVSATAANAQAVRESSGLRLAEHARATQQAFHTLDARLLALAPSGYSGDTRREYQWAAATAWLAFAFDSRAQRDAETSKAALLRATHLIERMETGDFALDSPTAGIETGPSYLTERLTELDAMKRDGRLRCAPAHIARLEVATIQAANAQRMLGWRHARPYWLAANELAAQAAIRIQHCKVQP